MGQCQVKVRNYGRWGCLSSSALSGAWEEGSWSQVPQHQVSSPQQVSDGSTETSTCFSTYYCVTGEWLQLQASPSLMVRAWEWLSWVVLAQGSREARRLAEAWSEPFPGGSLTGNGCWLEASVLHHGASTELPECPYNMAAGFPQSR